MDPLLETRDLCVLRGTDPVVEGVSLTLRAGEFVGLLGPNGAGKTTFLRAALGLLPHTGYSSLAALPAMVRARRAAFLPQGRDVAWPIAVADLVALGRQVVAGAVGPQPGAQAGHDPVARAMAVMDISHLATRAANALSGGELTRALIARALAQETPVLLADEPGAGLDPAQQIRAMEVFSDLARAGRAVLASVHDIGLAARYCSRLVVMQGGCVVADGAPGAVLTPALLDQVFGLRGALMDGPDGPVFQAMGRSR